MARVLILGCGCRGRALARTLMEEGHVIRGTTRDPAATERLAAEGIEPYVGDPDVVGTLMDSLENVTIVCHLLGDARGDAAALEALHGTRLRMLLEKLVDTSVRGFLYEAAGTVPEAALEGGAQFALWAQDRFELPVSILRADPADREVWTQEAGDGIKRLLAAERAV